MSELWNAIGLPILFGLISCIVLNIIFIYINNKYNIGQDKSYGIQKFHIKSTSRLGGLAIVISLFIVFITIRITDKIQILTNLQSHLFYFLISILPVFLGGIWEDITHKVRPNLRLLLASISALLLCNLLDFQIERTDVYLVDLLLLIPGVKILVTILVIAGFTHACNIVDGFNGLSSGLILIILLGLSCLAWKHNDDIIFQLCLINLIVLFGFFILNWPFGKIFLGDGGAYVIGFIVVGLGILLVKRNTQISPMAPVVLGLIPLIETLFSIYRRIFFRKTSINKPDALHLHTLIFRRKLSKKYKFFKYLSFINANASVGLMFLLPALILLSLTFIFYKNTNFLLFIIIIYTLSYVYFYKKIINFKVFKSAI